MAQTLQDMSLLSQYTVVRQAVALQCYIFAVSQEDRTTSLTLTCRTSILRSYRALEGGYGVLRRGGFALEVASEKVCRGTGGCRRYTVACRAAMGHLEPGK